MPEGLSLLLILPFGGVSLFTRETERHGGIYLNSVTVSESERYIITLKTICELASDKAFFAVTVSSMHCKAFTMAEFCTVTFAPQNMLANGEDVYLIDFDRARDQASIKARQDKMANPRRLLAVNPTASSGLRRV